MNTTIQPILKVSRLIKAPRERVFAAWTNVEDLYNWFGPKESEVKAARLDLRVGGVLAWTAADNVDPYRQRAESRSVNYRGGDPSRHDLGLELDAAIRGHWPLTDWLQFQAGIEGGLLFPGRAFDDDQGHTMGQVGLARLRLGLAF